MRPILIFVMKFERDRKESGVYWYARFTPPDTSLMGPDGHDMILQAHTRARNLLAEGISSGLVEGTLEPPW